MHRPPNSGSTGIKTSSRYCISSPPSQRTHCSGGTRAADRETGSATVERHGRPSRASTTAIQDKMRQGCSAELCTVKMTQRQDPEGFFRVDDLRTRLLPNIEEPASAERYKGVIQQAITDNYDHLRKIRLHDRKLGVEDTKSTMTSMCIDTLPNSSHTKSAASHGMTMHATTDCLSNVKCYNHKQIRAPPQQESPASKTADAEVQEEEAEERRVCQAQVVRSARSKEPQRRGVPQAEGHDTGASRAIVRPAASTSRTSTTRTPIPSAEPEQKMFGFSFTFVGASLAGVAK